MYDPDKGSVEFVIFIAVAFVVPVSGHTLTLDEVSPEIVMPAVSVNLYCAISAATAVSTPLASRVCFTTVIYVPKLDFTELKYDLTALLTFVAVEFALKVDETHGQVSESHVNTSELLDTPVQLRLELEN